MSSLSLARSTWLKCIVFNIKFKSKPQYTGAKSLYTSSSIGIDKFEQRRIEVQTRFINSKETFIEKMTLFCESSGRTYSIYKEDLRNMMYLCEDNEKDLQLLLIMIKKYISSEQRISDFQFGPEIMRLFYFLNLPHLAIQVFNEEDLSHFFNHVTSYVIYMTLLFNHECHEDVVLGMKRMMAKRVSLKLLPRANFTLTMAACYKMNSEKSLNQALDLIEKSEKFGGNVDSLVLSLASALALNQGKPRVGYELVGKTFFLSPILTNIKAKCLSELGRPEDALKVLRAFTDTPSIGLSREAQEPIICAETVDAVEKGLNERPSDDELHLEFRRVKEGLTKKSLIHKKSLDEMMLSPIELESAQKGSGPNDRQKNRAMIAASFEQGKNRERNDRTPKGGNYSRNYISGYK